MNFNYDDIYDSYVAREIIDLTTQFFDNKTKILSNLEEPFHTRVTEYQRKKDNNPVTIAIQKDIQKDVDKVKDLFIEVTSWRSKNFFIFEASYLAESMGIKKEIYETKDFKDEFRYLFLALYLFAMKESTNWDSHLQPRCRELISTFLEKLKKENPAAHNVVQGYMRLLFPQNPFKEASIHFPPLDSPDQELINLCKKFLYRCKGSFTINAQANNIKTLYKRLAGCLQTISFLAKHDSNLYFNQKLSIDEIKSHIRP